MASCKRVLLSYSVRKQLFLGYCFPKLYSTELASSKADQGGKDIVVPFRIQRGPTDILKALATTVGKDFTAAHYKYHDDPYFIPISNVSKRAFAFSKESGRKAARYFLENYPEYFTANESAPHIQAFDPPPTYNEDDLDEKVLQDTVKSHNLSDSIKIYNLLKKNNVSMSQETKVMLLELLCFYNEIPPLEYSEERWFSLPSSKQKISKTWKAKGTAEELFKDCDKDSAAYCAMIQGTAKYYDDEKAFALYDEMGSKNLPATVEVYNALLNLVPKVAVRGDMRWEQAMVLMSNMNREGLFPDLYTMNSLLSIVSRCDRWNKGKSLAMQILAEMKRLSIEPSLGSYHHVLKVFFQERENVSFPSVFVSILEKIEDKDLEIRHPDDVLFFMTAMEICQKYLKNVDLAYRLHAVLTKGKNSTLAGKNFNESIYYQNLFLLLCHNEDFEKYMEFYNKYVPNVYTPEVSVLNETMLAAELSGAYHYMPQIGSDLIMFEHSDREKIVSDFLRISGSIKQDEEVQKPLIDVVWKIKDLIEKRQSKMIRRSLTWTGSMLGDMLKIFLNGEDLEKARAVMLKLKNEELSIIGYPEKEVLMQFCSVFLEAKDFAAVNICIKYAVDSSYPEIRSNFENLVNGMFESQKLSENDRFQVNNILDRIEHEEDISIKASENCKIDNEKQSSNS